jgi:hypothetical protein
MQTNGAPRRGACKEERPSRIDLIVVDADPLARRLIVEILRKL